MPHTSPQSSYFIPTLKQKHHIPKSMQFGLLAKITAVWGKWDMPCPVPGSTTTLLPLTWEAGTSPTGLFGLGHSWVQTAQGWAERNHLLGSIFSKVQNMNLPHLEETLERTCSSFWVCQGGKTDCQAGKALWELKSSISSSELVTATRHQAQGGNTLCFRLRTLFCMKVKGAIVCMHRVMG